MLRHAARCERTVERVTSAAGDRPEGILRDAVDAGLMSAEEFVELVGKQPADVPSIEALLDEDDASAPDKRKTLEALLARGPVLVHVDARRAEVAVPPRFRADPSLVLRFGYNLSPAIVDLVVDDDRDRRHADVRRPAVPLRAAVDRGLRRDGRGRAARHRVARGRPRGRAHRRR